MMNKRAGCAWRRPTSLLPILQGLLVLLATLSAFPAWSRDPSGEPPPYCPICDCDRSIPPNCSTYNSSGDSLSTAEGNLSTSYAVPGIAGGVGTTPGVVLTYNSNKADGSQARSYTVTGTGWDHTYNRRLFSLRGHMFGVDGRGRITKYPLGPGGTFSVTPGWFETLVKNLDGSFTLRYKDGTVYRFALVAGTPYNIGFPVYRLQSITDRNNNITTLTYAGGLLIRVTDTYGRGFLFDYYPSGLLRSITDPLGRVTTFNYDATFTQLTQITDAAG